MPAFVKTPQDEKHWKYAKKIALRALHDKAPDNDEQDNKTLTQGKSWGFVTDRYKKLKSGNIKMKEEAIIAGYASLDYITEATKSRLMKLLDKIQSTKVYKKKHHAEDTVDILADIIQDYRPRH